MPRSYTGKKIEVGLDAYDPKIPPKLRSKENFGQGKVIVYLLVQICKIIIHVSIFLVIK
jgi:hypothetical protein